MAARAELIRKVISKANPESIVIGDRFWDSTIAYQHYGKGLSLDIIKQIKKTPPFNIIPDITFWLDIPIDLSTQREEGDSNISNHNALLLNKVRNGFKIIYESEPERVVQIDGTGEKSHVSDRIIKLIENGYNHKKKHG
jgi:dTMP kinase